MFIGRIAAVSIALLILAAESAVADALTVNRSTSAPTIAEFFVTEEGITAEIEIGEEDIRAFRNLLPDELFEKLGFDPQPLVERYKVFFTKDLIVKADGQLLVPKLESMEGRKRIRRDEITGEVLPSNEDDAEGVLAISFQKSQRPFLLHPRWVRRVGFRPRLALSFITRSWL